MATRVRAAEPLKEFAAALRLLRERAGHPTLRAMERRTDYSAATFCRAESGARVPSLGATLAYVRACGGDEELWRGQHAHLLAARRENRRVVFYPWRGFTPGRDEAATNEMTAAVEAYLLDRGGVESLAKAMQRMRAESGLTLAQIAKRTAKPEIAEQIGGKPLPVSTIGDLCNPGHGRVPSRRTLRGFLLALDAPEAALSTWEEARQSLADGWLRSSLLCTHLEDVSNHLLQSEDDLRRLRESMLLHILAPQGEGKKNFDLWKLKGRSRPLQV